MQHYSHSVRCTPGAHQHKEGRKLTQNWLLYAAISCFDHLWRLHSKMNQQWVYCEEAGENKKLSCWSVSQSQDLWRMFLLLMLDRADAVRCAVGSERAVTWPSFQEVLPLRMAKEFMSLRFDIEGDCKGGCRISSWIGGWKYSTNNVQWFNVA